MDFSDPFVIFVLFELACLLALIVIWLDIGFSFLHAALFSHCSPELLDLLFPNPDKTIDLGRDEDGSGTSESETDYLEEI